MRATSRRAWILAAALVPAALASPAAAAAQRTHLLVVSGLSGEPRFAADWATWTRQVTDAAGRDGVPATNIHVLSENGTGAARSTRENVLAALAAIGATADTTDQVVVVLFGHGSDTEGEPRLNLPGPDLTAGQMAAALGAVRARRIAVVNTASASGAWVKPLAGPGRIVIAATKSGTEQNETLFGGYFAAALSGDGADTDKDGRVSLLEAFDFARREVQRAYESTQRLQTEHAVLDADGDGVGTEAPVATSGDGARAALAFIGASGGRAVATSASAGATPELRALYARRSQLEAELTALRGRKDSMPAPDYQRDLEKLLLDISRNGQDIRKLGGAQ